MNGASKASFIHWFYLQQCRRLSWKIYFEALGGRSRISGKRVAVCPWKARKGHRAPKVQEAEAKVTRVSGNKTTFKHFLAFQEYYYEELVVERS